MLRQIAFSCIFLLLGTIFSGSTFASCVGNIGSDTIVTTFSNDPDTTPGSYPPGEEQEHEVDCDLKYDYDIEDCSRTELQAKHVTLPAGKCIDLVKKIVSEHDDAGNCNPQGSKYLSNEWYFRWSNGDTDGDWVKMDGDGESRDFPDC